MFEDFTLSTNIAAGCTVENKNPTQGSCGYEIVDEFFGLTTIFLTDNICAFVKAEGEYNGICYHNVTNNNLFGS